MKKPFQVISGGQTGVDRAALDVALAAGCDCGGWCPAGRLDENGVIPANYPVRELAGGGFRERTIQNLRDADGTLILHFGEIEGGTSDTLDRCIEFARPYKAIDGAEVSIERAAQLALEFVRVKNIRTLNVAGPRASKCPQAYDYAFAVVSRLLQEV